LWLYVPDGRKDGPTRLYAPEYIQLRILAEDGALRGEYSARYQVLGRPISANVSFHFEGKAGGTSSFEWQSDDGSRGVVDLKMLTAESLQVNWRVSRFGTRMGLGAGTAVLIRKITVARRLREVAMVRAADESSRGQSRPRPNDAGWK
jgi:hypothetical protein